MIKPTKAQMKVLILMKDGWELGLSLSITSYIWLQKDGLGRGGKTEKVHANTFNGLCLRGFIKEKERGFPRSRWVLTNSGNEAIQ